MSKVASFEIHLTRHLDPTGRALGPLPDFAKDPRQLIALYRAMTRTRAFDAKAIALQRTGRLGTYASSLGQEAVVVGIGAAMAADDILVPSFREQGAMLMRGVTMVEVLLYWGGDERGSMFAGPRQDFPVSVPVGTHAPHAAGAALAVKLRGERRAVLCAFGDGATSKGDVYEAMNMAGVWNLPVVFVINNNQWAISVPRKAQSRAQTLAQKAIGAGIPGEQVDGNDVVAVQDVVGRALERARAGEGPRLIEALTYRLSDHTTVDDATRYRSDSEVSAAWAEDPIKRLRNHLAERDAWTKADEERLIAETAREIEQAVAEYLEIGPQAPESMFDHLYARLPESLKAQREQVMREGRSHG